jgi:hypothetical protein
LQRPSQLTAAPGDDPTVWGLIFHGAPDSFAAPNPASSWPTISAAISELSAYLIVIRLTNMMHISMFLTSGMIINGQTLFYLF